MSGGLPILALKKDDVSKMLAAGTHIGAGNVHFQVRIQRFHLLSFFDHNECILHLWF